MSSGETPTWLKSEHYFVSYPKKAARRDFLYEMMSSLILKKKNNYVIVTQSKPQSLPNISNLSK
jgi:hypothetical protein